MYAPQHFQPDDDTLRELLATAVVGQLVTATSGGPLATMLPIAVDLDAGHVLAHMARVNPQWQTPWLGEALIIVQGDNAYVSPSWYASKAEHGRVVPTWNYAVLHISGELRVHDDQTWVRETVRRLTHHHEQHRDQPWTVEDAPQDFIAGQLRAIVGIELSITRLAASVKMSQNKSAADHAGVVAGLLAEGDPGSAAVAGVMQRVGHRRNSSDLSRP